MTVSTEVKEEVKVAEKKEITQPQTTPSVEASKPPEETQEQINWRKFRQEREKERKAKDESDRRAMEAEEKAAAMKAAMEAILNKPQPSHQMQTEPYEESETERIAKAVREEINKEKAKEKEEQKLREAAELPNNLSRSFTDFNSVCSQENLDYLEYHYPEVAAGFKNSPNSFDKWANIYKAVKRFVPNPDTKKDLAKIERNLSKPQSMSQPGMAATGDQAPTEMTEKRRQDNWVRMQRTLKGVK